MDPQLKSALTSLGAIATGAVATWAVSKGLITSADQATVAGALLAIGSAVVGVGLVWFKSRQLSQTAMIQAINAAPNGVKVVPNDSPTPAVNFPLRSPPPPGALA